ncbi:MAG: chemotaxis protein CheZ, partial [Alphaproteobacteria bacterium]|nr:chemotaxis protein CheZ [Alphaproteobacteria bacterium]
APAPGPPQPQGEPHAASPLPEKAAPPQQIARAPRVRTTAKLAGTRRAKSLDDLIAQIVASR